MCQRHKRCDGGWRGLREKGTHTDRILFTSLVKGASGALWWHVFTSAVMLMETRHNSSAVAPPCAHYAPLLQSEVELGSSARALSLCAEIQIHTRTLKPSILLNHYIFWVKHTHPLKWIFLSQSMQVLCSQPWNIKRRRTAKICRQKNLPLSAFYWLLWLSHTRSVAIWINLCRI